MTLHEPIRLTRRSNTRRLHPSYFDIIMKLDKVIARLLLKPTPADVKLDTVCVLLLYAQWMPYTPEHESPSAVTSKERGFRYNDVSVWTVLGLATRYALIMGLDRTCPASFQARHAVTEDDFSRFRVWVNLLSCDCLLMLTSGLPSSLDPVPTAEVVRVFSSHNSQIPGDMRVTALLELVVVAHELNQTGAGLAAHQITAAPLDKANGKLDDWER